MKMMLFSMPKPLFFGLLAFTVLSGCPAHAGERMNQFARVGEMEYLMNYQREKEELLKTPVTGGAVRNRLKILDNKINFLKQQIRLKRLQQPAPPALQPVKQPVVPAVPLRSRQPAAVRKGAQQQTSLRTEMKPESRKQPESLPAPLRLQPLSVSVERKSSTMVPVKVTAQGPAASESRNTMVEAPVPAKSAAKGGKKGSDWARMERADKEIYVLSVLGNLSRHNVFLQKSYNFYMNDLDRQLENDASLDNESLQRLLMKSAYAHEPEARKDLDKVWK